MKGSMELRCHFYNESLYCFGRDNVSQAYNFFFFFKEAAWSTFQLGRFSFLDTGFLLQVLGKMLPHVSLGGLSI